MFRKRSTLGVKAVASLWVFHQEGSYYLDGKIAVLPIILIDFKACFVSFGNGYRQ